MARAAFLHCPSAHPVTGERVKGNGCFGTTGMGGREEGSEGGRVGEREGKERGEGEEGRLWGVGLRKEEGREEKREGK